MLLLEIGFLPVFPFSSFSSLLLFFFFFNRDYSQAVAKLGWAKPTQIQVRARAWERVDVKLHEMPYEGGSEWSIAGEMQGRREYPIYMIKKSNEI